MGYELGPCQIYNNTDSTDLGKTNGGVTVSVEESTVALTTDQDGETPVDEQITGTTVTVECNLADITLSNLAFALKTSPTAVNGHVKVITNVGTSLLSNAKEISIRPYENGAVTTNKDRMLLIPKAGIKANMGMNYDSSNQRVIALTLTGYPDATLTGSPVAVWGASASSEVTE
jgi:hypothetical protein